MAIDGNIDLTCDQRRLVLELIDRFLPNTDVWAYGSRVNWTAGPKSDLDLVVFSDPNQGAQVSELKEALEDSDLPFRVDVLHWNDLPESFQGEIDRTHAALVEKVGCSPSDCQWPSVPIGDIAEIVGGGTPPTRDSTNFSGGIPWLTPRDLSRPHCRYVSGGARSLSSKGLSLCSARVVPAGTVLLSTRAPIGYVAIAAKPIATNQGFRSLIPADSVIPEYLYYWLKGHTSELESYATGTTFSELSARSLKAIRIPVPPLPIQRRIAEILGTLDDRIYLCLQMNVTLRQMIEVIFQSWIGDVLDNETRSSIDVVDTHASTVWRRATLSEIVDIHSGGTPATSVGSYWDGGIPWLTAKDAPSSDEVFAVDTLRTISKAGLENSAAELLPPYTTAITARGTVGKLACLAVPMALNQTCYGLRGVGYPDFFIFWMMKTITSYLQQQSHGTIFDTITRQSFDAISIVVPPTDIADKFEVCVDPLMKRILANLYDVRVLSKLRDRFSEQLLSNKLSLSE